MREQIERIYNELMLPLPAAREMKSMLDEAISSDRQHRWLEALLSRLLMEAPADAPASTDPEDPDTVLL